MARGVSSSQGSTDCADSTECGVALAPIPIPGEVLCSPSQIVHECGVGSVDRISHDSGHSPTLGYHSWIDVRWQAIEEDYRGARLNWSASAGAPQKSAR